MVVQWIERATSPSSLRIMWGKASDFRNASEKHDKEACLVTPDNRQAGPHEVRTLFVLSQDTVYY